MLIGCSGIHAELGVRRGTITPQGHKVLNVHVGIEPFDILNTLAEKIGRHAPGY